MSQLWKLAIVGALFFVLGSITVASADKIKQFVISNEDGSQNVGVTEDGRLKVDAGELAVTLPDVQTVAVNNFPASSVVEVSNFTEVQAVEVGNFPLTPDGRLMVTPPAPEGATLLQTLDVELNAETDAFTEWVDVRGFTRFLLFSRLDKHAPGQTGTALFLSLGESPDGVLNYGGVSGNSNRSENSILRNDDGTLCSVDCNRLEIRAVNDFEGDFFFLRMKYQANGAATPATIDAQLYGLP